MVKIDIKKKHVYFLVGIFMILCLGFVIAVTNPNPGHLLEQIDTSDCSTGQVLMIDEFGEWTCGEASSGGDSIPQGFCMFSDTQAICPEGWTRKIEFDGRTIAGVSNGIGATGGSEIHLHATSGHILTEAEMPLHDHQIETWEFSTEGTPAPNNVDGITWVNDMHENTYWTTPKTLESGGNEPHTHGNTEEASSWPPYINVLICCKD